MSKKILLTLVMGLASALTMAQSQAAAVPTKSTTLANSSDFIILSDIDAPSFEAFLSYTGAQFNHCGVAIRTPSWIDVSVLQKVLTIDAGPSAVTQVENGRLVARLTNPNRSGFGGFFKVKSISGENLKDAIASLSAYDRAEAIVEILGCK